VALDDALLDGIRVGTVMDEIPCAVRNLAGVLRRRTLPERVDKLEFKLANLIFVITRLQTWQRVAGGFFPHADRHQQPVPELNLIHSPMIVKAGGYTCAAVDLSICGLRVLPSIARPTSGSQRAILVVG
jgi:hypothetical protein